MKPLRLNPFQAVPLFAAILFVFQFATCKYSTRDTAPIPPEITTFRVNYFDNRARYVNPQLSPQLTERFKQRVISQTRLREVSDDPHYDISGYISTYSVTTSGVANQQAARNRLNVGFHLIFKNTLDPSKNFEADVSSNFDFDASKSLAQAESELSDQILKTLSEAIFNRIFSNW